MRRGETTPPPPREVRIDAINLESFDVETQRAVVLVRCSKGTYVRQIAADLGAATGAGAHCVELRRLEVGPFSVAQAGTPEQIAAGPDGPWALGLREALPHLPERRLTSAEREDVRHGRIVEGSGEGPVRLVHEGELVAVARAGERGLQPVAVLSP
jgi:tRNA pseudouridine55 synthase